MPKPTIEDIEKKIADAPSQETLTLASQAVTLDDDEAQRVTEAIRKRQRLTKINAARLSLSPAATEGFFRECLYSPTLTKVVLYLYNINSPSQKHSMRMAQEFPMEVDDYVANLLDTRRFNLFKKLNKRTFKMEHTTIVGGQQAIKQVQCMLPEQVLDVHLRPFLVPKKEFHFE